MTNKETLDLSLDLGIGVKTHSSGIEEAQADRVRRRAEREGLTRPEQPEEPKPVKATKATKSAKGTKKAGDGARGPRPRGRDPGPDGAPRLRARSRAGRRCRRPPPPRRRPAQRAGTGPPRTAARSSDGWNPRPTLAARGAAAAHGRPAGAAAAPGPARDVVGQRAPAGAAPP